MKREDIGWTSPRIGKEMRIIIYGHSGAPIVVFPTSGGDQREYEGQGMIEAIAHHIEAGRVRIFTINSINNESWYDKQIHPAERASRQVVYDDYLISEVVPFIFAKYGVQLPITTTGASFGAFHAANSLFKHPDVFQRCFALSGVFDLRSFMNGHSDQNFYFNNPVDYVANLTDEQILGQLRACDIHFATGSGPWENSKPSYRMAEILHSRGIPHHVDDWGTEGGHDWPYWKRQMDTYINHLF